MIVNIIYYFICLIKFSKEKYITIPFKIINKEEPDKFVSIDDYFAYWYNLNFYSELLIGTPKQKILTKLTFDDFGISILNKGCDYDSNLINANPLLNLPNSSLSFNKTNDTYDEKSFSYKNFYDAFYAKDIFYFNNNIKTNLKFIYSPNDNKKLSTCFNIGFMAYNRNMRENSLNILKQLKDNNIINSYDWSILYNEGLFLIGRKPHEYKPEVYDKNYLFGSAYYYDNIIPYFNIKINSIFFKSPEKSEENIYINDSDILYLIPTRGLIKGTFDYEDKIEKFFFMDFIQNNKCFKEITNDNKRSVFTCINSKDIKEELKSKFPTLKLVHKNFLYTFELDYEDLFKEKGDRIYFLIWFDSSVKVNLFWEMGLPFTKKYLFNYNYDTKLISFYNDDIKKIEKQNSKTSFKKDKIILIIVLAIIVCVLGFLIGRRNTAKRNKLTAKELESNFNHPLNENSEIPYKSQI